MTTDNRRPMPVTYKIRTDGTLVISEDYLAILGWKPGDLLRPIIDPIAKTLTFERVES